MWSDEKNHTSGKTEKIKSLDLELFADVDPIQPENRQIHAVSVFGLWVSGCRFRVSGFGFRVSGFGIRVSDLGFGVSGLGLRVEG